jgi:hypothetical protein
MRVIRVIREYYRAISRVIRVFVDVKQVELQK